MSSIPITLFFIISILIPFSFGDVITCPGSTQCNDNDIFCNPNEDCTVNCNAYSSCGGKTIHCPENGDCDINCQYLVSCYQATINATNQNGNFNLQCNGIYYATKRNYMCSQIQIYGSTLSTNNGKYFNVTCAGDSNACSGATINCAEDMDCFVECIGSTSDGEWGSSCYGTTINGPTAHSLKVECSGKQGCYDALIHGGISSELDIDCSPDDYTCYNLSFWCPLSSGANKNCVWSASTLTIDGWPSSMIEAKIYAVHGWIDIDTTGITGVWGRNNGGYMYCGLNYSESCEIDEDLTCANVDDFCNNVPTPEPTTPTNKPTGNPTNEPTNNPTNNPTIPSNRPTCNPTTIDNPTAYPTHNPTTSTPSTSNPTIKPTNEPTNEPTIEPTNHMTITILITIVAAFCVVICVVSVVKIKGRYQIKQSEIEMNMMDQNVEIIGSK